MADRIRPLAATLLAGCTLSACSFAPDYRPPVSVAPVAFRETGPWAPAAPASLPSQGDWWTVYADKDLDGLERRIDTANPTLAEALGRYDQAQAYLAEASASILPNIGTSSQITANRQSDNRPTRGYSKGAGGPDFYGADTFGAQLNYELDLWGRVRNTVAAGKAEVQASNDDVQALKLSLESQVATSYVTLRGQDRQMELLEATVDAYSQADAMTQRRFKGGIATGIETGQSGAQLAEAQAQLADVRASRALTEHAIASLVGQPASTFTIAPDKSDLKIPNTPVGLPSGLLQRRPDIAAAERRMAAANARIGIAKAAYFPTISLSALGGYQSTQLPALFTAPNTFWSIGPSAALTVFDAGRRRAEVQAARAEWIQATSAYRGQVLQAIQEVEDNLALMHRLGEESEAERQADRQASQAEQLSLNRYAKGAVDYLGVVTTQTTALRIRRNAIDLDTRRLQASVRLMVAIGGGWTIPAGPSPSLVETDAPRSTGKSS